MSKAPTGLLLPLDILDDEAPTEIYASPQQEVSGGTVGGKQNSEFPESLRVLMKRNENKTEAPTGFEPVNEGFADPCLTTWRRRPRAEDGIRTRDPLLGKEMLYR